MSIRYGIGLLAVLLAVGCGKSAPDKVVEKPRPVSLASGTGIPLVLLEPIDSGGTKEGERVAFIVAEDVKVGGQVVIPRGAPAEGVVAYSRAAGTLSALMNTPARLAVRMERAWAPDGTEIRLCTVQESVEEPYAFTRDNTSKVGGGSGLDELWASEDSQRLLSQLAADLEEGRALDLGDPEVRKTLAEAADKLGMGSTARLLEEGEIKQASDLLSQVRRGGSATALLSGASLTTVGAAMELVNLAGNVGSRVTGMLKGRNIKAHVGTRVQAYVASPASLLPVPRPKK